MDHLCSAGVLPLEMIPLLEVDLAVLEDLPLEDDKSNAGPATDIDDENANILAEDLKLVAKDVVSNILAQDCGAVGDTDKVLRRAVSSEESFAIFDPPSTSRKDKARDMGDVVGIEALEPSESSADGGDREDLPEEELLEDKLLSDKMLWVAFFFPFLITTTKRCVF